jgi:hypothetical protein
MTLDPPPPPDGADAARRRSIVERAAAVWSSQVVDLGGRNTLLYYRDLRVGTLDLTPSPTVDATGVRMLLMGRAVRLSQLLVPEELAANAKRARTIAAKAAENYDERGLQTLFLALGTATWTSTRSEAVPAAPVLLAPLRLTARGGAAEDFDLALADDWDLNPTLVQVLRTDFQLTVDVDDVVGDGANPAAALARLREVARPEVAGFDIVERLVVGNFSYAKQPMAIDLAGSVDAMARHPVVRAIAGDPEARRDLLAAQPAVDPRATDHLGPAAEHLVLDADASQSQVIASVLAGGNLVVQGPPGTGKSQTIANLVAALAAEGRSVLFVAEKRAAIDAVTDRLERVGLGDLVLDLHGGTTSRRAMLATIGRALEGFGTVPAVDLAEEQRRLEAERDVLAAHVRALHEPRRPFGRSVHELQSIELGIRARTPAERALPRAVAQGLSWDDLTAATAGLEEWVGLGGATLADSGRPWAAAADRITTAAQAEAALDLVEQLAGTVVPSAASALGRTLAEAGLRPPVTVADAAARLELVQGVSSTLDRYAPGLFELGADALAALHVALGPSDGGAVSRLFASVTNRSYRDAKRRVAEFAIGAAGPAERRADVAAAERQLAAWHELRTDAGHHAGPTRSPRPPRRSRRSRSGSRLWPVTWASIRSAWPPTATSTGSRPSPVPSSRIGRCSSAYRGCTSSRARSWLVDSLPWSTRSAAERSFPRPPPTSSGMPGPGPPSTPSRSRTLRSGPSTATPTAVTPRRSAPPTGSTSPPDAPGSAGASPSRRSPRSTLIPSRPSWSSSRSPGSVATDRCASSSRPRPTCSWRSSRAGR